MFHRFYQFTPTRYKKSNLRLGKNARKSPTTSNRLKNGNCIAKAKRVNDKAISESLK